MLKKASITMLAAVFLALGISSAASAKVIYVDDDATGTYDGASWENAYNFLQDALMMASSGEEIRVAQGVYKPDDFVLSDRPSRGREETFQLINGVTLKGGYAGFGQPDPNARDAELYETILSGDLDGNDVAVADPRDLLDEPSRAENSYHVVTARNTAILDGFTISGGNANGAMSPHDVGGGMHTCDYSNATVHECTFSGNSAKGGGGMSNSDNSRPTVEGCTFSGNSANGGGGMSNTDNSRPIVEGCTFSGNSANQGGGMGNGDYSRPTVQHCTFSGNSANHGGGMYNWKNRGTVHYCTFSGNSAVQEGGAVYNYFDSSPTLTNCAFTYNSAHLGGGMHNDFSNPTVTNCTFSDNSAYTGGGMSNYWSSPIVRNCTFSGNTGNGVGGGMCNADSSPTIEGCTFSGNAGVRWGGGMWSDYSRPLLTNCIFSGNAAGERGGGMGNWESNPTVQGCTFSGNSAERYGGGMSNDDESSPAITNSTFSDNSAAWGGGMCNQDASSPAVTNSSFSGNSARDGGGIYNQYRTSPILTKCTIVDNRASNGPGLACDSYQQNYPSTVTIVNSIVWNGPDSFWNNDSSTMAITNSDIQGGWSGEGNMDADPCFAAPGYWDANGTPEDANDDFWVDGDYHLKSQAGRWDANEGRWTIDDVTSPCIDVGDPMSPVEHEPFPNGGIVNVGAYGGTAEASKSYFGEPLCETIVAGDVNGDCVVDFRDFFFIALHWVEGR